MLRSIAAPWSEEQYATEDKINVLRIIAIALARFRAYGCNCDMIKFLSCNCAAEKIIVLSVLIIPKVRPGIAYLCSECFYVGERQHYGGAPVREARRSGVIKTTRGV